MPTTTYQLVCEIAESGSISGAAEKLHLTPSAASHSLNSVEHNAGFLLFNRERGGVTLTREGEHLLPYFRAILGAEIALEEEIMLLNSVEKGKISIGVFNSVCENWLPDILRSFHSKYPKVEVQIVEGGYPTIEAMLLEGKLDMGFASLPTHDKFNTIPLIQDQLMCVVPPDYVPENKDYITAKELQGMDLLLSQPCCDRDSMKFIIDNKLNERLRHKFTLESSAISLVESGMGFTIIPELVLIGYRGGNYRAFPLEGGRFRTIAIATMKKKRNTPVVAGMIKEICDYVSNKYENNSIIG